MTTIKSTNNTTIKYARELTAMHWPRIDVNDKAAMMCSRRLRRRQQRERPVTQQIASEEDVWCVCVCPGLWLRGFKL
jgi:hypothetical protein